MIQFASRNDKSDQFLRDLLDTPLFREMSKQPTMRNFTSELLCGLKNSFQSASSGIDGKTRILSTVATLLTNNQLKEVLQPTHGKPISDYQITKARRHAAQFGPGGQSIVVHKPTEVRISKSDILRLTEFLHEDTNTKVGFYTKLRLVKGMLYRLTQQPVCWW